MVKLQTILYLILGIVSVLLWSCTDVPTSGSPPPDYHALTRFVNVATDAPGALQVRVDGSAMGSPVAFGDFTQYMDVLAGSRRVGVGTETPQTVTFTSNSQNTVLILPSGGSSRYLSLNEGYLFRNNHSGTPNTADVMFIHAAEGSAPTVSFLDTTAAGPALRSDAQYATAGPFAQVGAGAHTVVVVSNGGYSSAIDAAQSVPPTSSTTTGSGSVDLTVADGFTYSVTLKSSPADGFYTGGHFAVGATGSNGSVVLPIDISAQTINFADGALSGLKTIPPDSATTANGTITCFLDTAGLQYTITIKRDSSGRGFISGHFHNAADGSAGAIVKDIANVIDSDTTITGTWGYNDSSQPLTSHLLGEFLAGNIYLDFHSARDPLGEIRSQLEPTATTNTFTGSWADIPDSVKDRIVAGEMYVSFENAAHSAGVVRGQLAVDPARGQYGVASSSVTTFSDGRVYTVIATGSGKSLALHVLGDRQYGVTKVGTANQVSPRLKAR